MVVGLTLMEAVVEMRKDYMMYLFSRASLCWSGRLLGTSASAQRLCYHLLKL
jgi:hypothetical protein